MAEARAAKPEKAVKLAFCLEFVFCCRLKLRHDRDSMLDDASSQHGIHFPETFSLPVFVFLLASRPVRGNGIG
jgi:hypothetical protein